MPYAIRGARPPLSRTRTYCRASPRWVRDNHVRAIRLIPVMTVLGCFTPTGFCFAISFDMRPCSASRSCGAHLTSPMPGGRFRDFMPQQYINVPSLLSFSGYRKPQFSITPKAPFAHLTLLTQPTPDFPQIIYIQKCACQKPSRFFLVPLHPRPASLSPSPQLTFFKTRRSFHLQPTQRYNPPAHLTQLHFPALTPSSSRT